VFALGTTRFTSTVCPQFLFILAKKQKYFGEICAFWVATLSNKLTEPGVSKEINVLHYEGQGFVELVRLLDP